MGHLEFQIMTHFSLILYNYYIDAKYEISLKLAQYFHRKCHLKFFMNGCPGNQSCHAIFIKNFIYVIRTLSLIFLWKINFLAQRVHVSEIFIIFSNFTPPTQGQIMIRPDWVSLFYIGRCPICFMQNISLIGTVVLEKKSFKRFLPYMGMAAIWNFKSLPF